MVAFVLWRGWRGELQVLLGRPLVWLMALGVAGYQGFFFVGVDRAGVAVGTLVALGSAPLLAGLLGWAVREGAPGWTWLLATGLALSGLALLTGTGGGDALGVAAALAAGGSYAVYTVLGARLARDGHNASVVMAAPFALGALLLAPFLAGAGWLATPTGVLLALWLGLAATSCGLPAVRIGTTGPAAGSHRNADAARAGRGDAAGGAGAGGDPVRIRMAWLWAHPGRVGAARGVRLPPAQGGRVTGFIPARRPRPIAATPAPPAARWQRWLRRCRAGTQPRRGWRPPPGTLRPRSATRRPPG